MQNHDKLDKFDYAEPSCPLCGGKEFYYPDAEAPLGRIPVDRVISKLDECFDKNNMEEAGRLLKYWRDEAISLRDSHGELTMQSELVGYFRKMGDRDGAMAAIERALDLCSALGQGDMVSGATVFLNCATAYKAFGMAERSLELFEKAKEIYNKLLAPDDARMGGLYNNMALTLVDLGKFDEAEAAYESAVSVMSSGEKRRSELAITYVNMAHMYESAGEGEKIIPIMAEAYDTLSRVSERDGYFAFVLDKCAPSFKYFGFDDIAEELLQMSREIYEGA